MLWREALDAHRPVTAPPGGHGGCDAYRSSEGNSHSAGGRKSSGGGGRGSGGSSTDARSEARELQWWRVRLSKSRSDGDGGGGALRGGEAELVEKRLRSSLAALRDSQRDDSERKYRRERDLITARRDANIAQHEVRLERAEMRRRQTARLSSAPLTDERS